MNIYTGILKYENIDFVYAFDGKILKLIPKDNKNLISMTVEEIAQGIHVTVTSKIVSKSVIVGFCNETCQNMAFIMRQGSRINCFNEYLTMSPIAYIEFKSRINQGKKMVFSGQELDLVFPVNKAYTVFLSREEGVYSTKSVQTRSHGEIQTEKLNFSFQDKIISVWFSISHLLNTASSFPLEFESSMIFDFEKTDDYMYVVQLAFIARRFLQFLCNRKNVMFKSVELYGEYDEHRDTVIAELHLLYEESLIDNKKTISSHFIPYKCIEKHEGEIFQEISNDTLYFRHLPESYTLGKNITPASFVMITAAFEWEFRKCYSNGVIKSKKTIDAENKVCSLLDNDIINNSGKTKEILKWLRNLVGKDNLSSEIYFVCDSLKKIVEPIGKYIYGLNSENYDISQIGQRVANQRNDFAHGNIDKEFNDLAFLDIIFLQRLVYVLQLKKVGVEDDEILEAINSLFNMNILIK